MKKINSLLLLLSILLLQTACREKPVTNRQDYAGYLQTHQANGHLQHIDSEIEFWSKRLVTNSGDIVAESKIAGLLISRFAYSGNIQEIYAADSLYKKVNVLNRVNSSGTYRSLASNCITQHQFKQAMLYIDSAKVLGDDKYLTTLIEIDVSMELGNYIRARRALNSLADKKAFEYLVREAKYKDHVEGDLDAAIKLMEQAKDNIKDNPNKGLQLWTISNLGDMYGHANRYRESYQCYLDVLKQDSSYYHVLKGIAWLAFSHDKNPASAKEILFYLQRQHPVPDYDLLLADIADYEKDTVAARQYREKFMAATGNYIYGDMYNKYRFTLEADQQENAAQAFAIAEKEIQNRPTPEAFSWLARAYSEKGESNKAMDIAHQYVENKCYEPDALYNLGIIYKVAGKKNMARRYLNEAKLSSYELGPVKAAHVQQLLSEL